MADRKRLADICVVAASLHSRPSLAPSLSPASTAPASSHRAGTAARLRPAGVSPRIANYDIDVTLDPATRTLTGSEIITWRNPGAIAGLFDPAASVLERVPEHQLDVAEAAPAGRRQSVCGAAPEGDFGYTNVTSLTHLNADGSETDLLPRFRYISPDDQNRDDRSLAAADLPVARAARRDDAAARWRGRGASRATSIAPARSATTSSSSQWFPKLGVFDDGGWTAHQFFANSEFFADFGRYDVRMTVPSGWIVGATGVEQSRTPDAGDRTTHRYVQDDVHDFAWTTSPDFVEQPQQFEHAGPAAGATCGC